MTERTDGSDDLSVRNDVHSERISGSVVQIRDLTGDLVIGERNGINAEIGTPRQLPASARFVGRSAELDRLTGLLDGADDGGRVVVISSKDGVDGMGRTTLAVRWATDVIKPAPDGTERFPDGQLFVDLGGPKGFVSPDDVISSLLGSFGVTVPSTPADRLAAYKTVLSGKRVLLVLDDARNADQVLRLLPGSRTCWVVVTSRVPLPELTAAVDAQVVSVGPMSERDSYRILAQRFDPADLDAESQAVGELIELCGGLPYALATVSAYLDSTQAFPFAVVVAQLRQERARLLDALHPDDVRPTRLLLGQRVVARWAAKRTAENASDGVWALADRAVTRWARDPRALVVAAVVVAVAVLGTSTTELLTGTFLVAGYFLLRFGSLIAGAILLARPKAHHPVGAGLVVGNTAFCVVDAVGNLTNRPDLWAWLELLAILILMACLWLRWWPPQSSPRRPSLRQLEPRILVLVVIAGVFVQLILIFVPITSISVDSVGPTPITFTIIEVEGTLGAMLAVLPIGVFCILIALGEQQVLRARMFATATVVAYLAPELYLLLGSLLLGPHFSYIGDDVYGVTLVSSWIIPVQAALTAIVGLAALSNLRRARSAPASR
jgi:hypothetical protein